MFIPSVKYPVEQFVGAEASAVAVPALPDHVPDVESTKCEADVPEPERGESAVTDESFPLNVVQSAAESTPAEEPDEVAEEIIGFVPPEDARGYVADTEVTQ